MAVDPTSYRAHFRYWVRVAKRQGWRNPVHIIGYVDAQGRLLDSASYDGLTMTCCCASGEHRRLGKT